LHVRELVKNFRVSAYAGILGVIVPVACGWGLGELLGFSNDHAIFLGLTLGATSVSISAQTLMELKVLRSRVGLGLLGAAVFDDILVILLLSSFLALMEGGNGFGEILFVLLRMLAFLLICGAVGKWILPRLARRIARLPVSQAALTFAVVMLLLFGLASELIGGMAAITGTFLAGLMFSRTPERAEIQNGFRPLAYGFFVPIFFVTVGLGVNLRELSTRTIAILVLITAAAVLGKVAGAGLGARLAKFSWHEALQLGIGLVSRGEVGLIVAKMGLDRGYLEGEIFSAIVGMVLISTLITPPMLRSAFQRFPSAGSPSDKSVQP
jgi:Kef-type K+ transport system membrane component KefB